MSGTPCIFQCPACGGSGWDGDQLCGRCDAYGTVDGIRASDLQLLPDDHDHEIARFEDEGNPHG